MSPFFRLRYCFIPVVLCLCITHLAALTAHAVPVFVATPAGLGASTSFDWSTLTNPLANPLDLSAGGTGFTVTSNGGSLSVTHGASFFLTNGGVEDILLRAIEDDAVIRLDFDTPVRGVGASVEWGGFEQATYEIVAFYAGGSSVSHIVFSPGTSGEPAFLGFLSNIAEITAVEFRGTSDTPPHSFAMSDPLFVTAVATPEPSTLLLGGLAVTLLGARRRRMA